METAIKTKWVIDSLHSNMLFKIKHLGISTVAGTFNKFSGEASSADDSFDDAEVNFAVEASSINTNHPERDGHLRSKDFFNAEVYPTITFQGVLAKKDGDYTLAGDLTLLAVTKQVVLDVDFGGIGKGRFGDKRAGFEVSGKISRKDFGLTWNILADGAGFVIGEEVKLHFDIQLVEVSA